MTPSKQSTFVDTALSPKDAAQYIGVSIATLNRWRYSNGIQLEVIPPHYYKVGGRIFYQRRDLDSFLERCAVTSLDKAY